MNRRTARRPLEVVGREATADEPTGWLARVQTLRLGRSRWTMPSLALLGLAVVLSAVGLTFVASASSVASLHATGDSWSTLHRQIVWVVAGMVAMTVTALLPYRVWWSFGLVLFLGSVAGTVATVVGFGLERNGSSRWIGGDSYGFQPSEFLKLGTIVMLAGIFAKQTRRDVMADWPFLKRLLLILAVSMGPVLKQPDMGTATIIGLSAAAIIVTAGMPGRRIGQGIAGGLAGATLYAMSSSYRRDRLTAFLRPEHDVTGVGWHVAQSKLGFASGRLLGVGIGASRAKWGFVPNAHTDFVFAIIGEELGLVGATVVLLLFVAIGVIGLSVANHAQDRFGSLIAVGVTMWIISQALINMGAVLGVLPVTGVPLPFVSYGGSSFIVVAAAFGVLVNIARSAEPRRARVRTRGERPVRSAVAASPAR